MIQDVCLSYFSQDYSRYSRNLLQTLFKLVQSYNELVWNEVAFVIAAFATQTNTGSENYVAEFSIIKCEVQLLQEVS